MTHGIRHGEPAALRGFRTNNPGERCAVEETYPAMTDYEWLANRPATLSCAFTKEGQQRRNLDRYGGHRKAITDRNLNVPIPWTTR